MTLPGNGFPSSSSGDPRQNHRPSSRTLVVNEAITSTVGNRLVQQLTLLGQQSEEPIQVVMSNAPGGDGRAGLSVHDSLQSLGVPVTMLGSGRIAGAGVLAFVGAASDRRVGLPHVRFRFESPTAPEHTAGADPIVQAEEAREHRERVVRVLAAATGQSEEQVATDLDAQRALDAEEAVAYGLVDRIVESRRAIE